MDHRETHSMDDLPRKNSWEEEDPAIRREEDNPEDQEDHPEDQEDHLEDQEEVELSKGKPRDPPTSSLVENHKYLKETDPKLRNLSPSGTYSSELTTQTQRSKTPTKEA